jgi:ParB-like chromosome segregation protein Spo0J
VNDSDASVTPPETPQVSPPAEPLPSPSPSPDHSELRALHPAPAHIALERVDDDDSFKARDEGDVAALAMDIARLGQLFPVDLRLKPPDRFQIVTGFRRVAALRFLHREKVLARLHVDLNDDDAALIALADAIHAQPVSRDELVAMRERLEAKGTLSAAARDMLDKALSLDEALAPEDAPTEVAEAEAAADAADEEEEVDADELASDVTQRLGQINQDLSLLADVFSDLDEERRETLLQQLKYSAELVAFLQGGGE